MNFIPSHFIKLIVTMFYMKIFYIPKTPFGTFYYNPISKEGVSLNEDGAMVLGMAGEYDPRMHPNYKELEVDEGVFKLLVDSALMHFSGQAGIKRALIRFPRECLPQY